MMSRKEYGRQVAHHQFTHWERFKRPTWKSVCFGTLYAHAQAAPKKWFTKLEDAWIHEQWGTFGLYARYLRDKEWFAESNEIFNAIDNIDRPGISMVAKMYPPKEPRVTSTVG